MKFQSMTGSQLGHEARILVRRRPAQLVVKVGHREHDAQLVPQLKQDAQERD